MKKIIALFLTIALCVSIAACGNSSQSNGTDSSASASGDTSAKGKKPSDLKQFTIGVAEGLANDETVIRRQYYEKYIAPKYNVKFIFSEMLKDASAELSFIENCADSGADAIIDFKGANPSQMAQICKKANMKYILNFPKEGSAQSTYQENLSNFLGGFAANQPDTGRMFGEYLKKHASKDGKEGFLISSAIASSGNEQHIQITEAALNALKELYGLNYKKSVKELAIVDAPTQAENDKGINIFVYPGSSTKDSWLPGVSAALQTGKYGFFISAGQSYTSTSVVVDEVERSFNKDIKVVSVASLGKSLTTAFNSKDKFGNASINLATVKSVSIVSAGLFAMVYNGLTGFDKNMKQADGSSSSLSFKMWSVENAEQLAIMNNWDSTETGKWIADFDFIDSLLGLYHSDITAETFQKNVDSCDYESTLKKLGK